MVSQPRNNVSTRDRFWKGKSTHNNTCNTVLWVAVLLELLRHNGEDTWWKSHIEDSVLLLSALLQLLQVLAKSVEGLVLVILAVDVGANLQELLQLALDLLRWSLNGGLNSLEELLMVHLRSRISDDLDVLWEKLVAELLWLVSRRSSDIIVVELTNPKRAGNYAFN